MSATSFWTQLVSLSIFSLLHAAARGAECLQVWPSPAAEDRKSDRSAVDYSLNLYLLTFSLLVLFNLRQLLHRWSCITLYTITRHAPRCSRDLPSCLWQQAGYDVQCYTLQGDQSSVQEVHAECGHHFLLDDCIWNTTY